MRLGEMLLPAVFIPAAATVHVLRALAGACGGRAVSLLSLSAFQYRMCLNRSDNVSTTAKHVKELGPH